MRIARAVLLAVVAMPVALRAGAPTHQLTDTYHALVTVYRQAGRVGDPALLNAPAASIEEAVAAAIDARAPAWNWEDLRAAAVMHTDVWFRGAMDGTNRSTAHLDAAARLLDHVVRTEVRQRSFAERWYDLVPKALKHFRLAQLGEAFQKRGMARFAGGAGRDRALASYRRGLEYEYEGATLSTHQTNDAELFRAWAGAASQFVEALDWDPGLRAAALHLGRVRMLQGNFAEAERQFHAAVEADDPRVSYLARLYLGSIAERGGRLEAALEQYSSALRFYPGGQSAVVAMAQVLSRHGRQLEARDLLSRLIPSARGLVVEPLWTYLPQPRATLGDLVALLEEMRMEVSR